MVESGREYVLQWPGHAAYVTERFSGLLARQTLVDVTLICDEQKLRVHKLVLASCSLYFEEILAEDLGPEPIILLRDLNFSILKAMIEFMYCGETTVSHVYLPSLLAAARLFKVKELESLVENMVGSITQSSNCNEGEYLPNDVGSSGRANGVINNEDNGIRVSFTNKKNCQSNYRETNSSDSESERNYIEENISETLSDSPNDRSLYEDPCGIPKSKMYSTLLRNSESKDGPLRKNDGENSVELLSDSSSTLDSENCEKDSESTRLYKRCYEFVSNGCAKGEGSSQLYLTPESTDNEINRVGQCSKVYTHKKRKANGDNTLKRHTHLDKTLPQPLVSNSIDLTDDSSNEEAPVTLKTNLDGESSDYLLSFNNESIQSIVGCSLSDFCPSGRLELINARTHSVDEKNSVKVGREEDRTPVLRRSVRLNQQESEETLVKVKSKLKDGKKSSPDNIKLFSRTKRKNKELERRVPNVKVIVTATQSTSKSHSRPLRRTSKLVDRCTPKNHLAKSSDKPKTVEKLTNSVSVHERPEATETVAGDNQHLNDVPVKSNIRASSVNRALWGDMSDMTEDGEVNEEFLEYSQSAEIPFAVGLLPLRAALERMQATLDHQPRKTRSSVASTKQEPNNLKRKNSPLHETVAPAKKQNIHDIEVEENASAVCHIQIRTSSPCSKLRKRSLSDGTTASLSGTAVNGRP
ncbi:zinc finger and BTB domain-containing protein 18.3 [Copidosoma floridanum]|uniref:zinc finger and BTB domain-containing protein 18.3 n=1 Tax=Copidosoma floridanum TaxID=29053 RepID=UPI0006C9490E|nr:zinc finger and BTB domain-containing protein 18.3 [Copidosoma floridanum]XP_014203705.1 zinc finger and BTB domain-containing protein 18.3 [Copidosoma floridanum]XP_014203706.1 zinc finger and BTB domain-containing protein 18.3 [Copidosoma floridanum]XP_014203707.1 zinc finger and BTB domain-containing protein 18.3 [Copidosoma floridanum]